MYMTTNDAATLLFGNAIMVERPSLGSRLVIAIITIMCFSTTTLQAQVAVPPAQSQAASAQDAPGTSTDLFVMLVSDFDRPGLVPRANYNVGMGHTFGFLRRDLIGDELTFGYTYENSGPHGLFHTPFGEYTECGDEKLRATKNESHYRLHVAAKWHYELYGQGARSKQA